MPPFEDPQKRAEAIRTAAQSLCKAFAAGESPYKTLDTYFTRDPQILEHGPLIPSLPFLGTAFSGRRRSDSSSPSSSLSSSKKQETTCDDHYDLLTSMLSFRPDDQTVPPRERFFVDAENGAVTVRLHTRFASVKTGKSWEEDFVYVLSEFDEDARIGRQELWADPLSAFMAVQE